MIIVDSTAWIDFLNGKNAPHVNFRSLRKRGITECKTIDLLIGTWCIENRRPLLRNDKDFRPMTVILG